YRLLSSALRLASRLPNARKVVLLQTSGMATRGQKQSDEQRLTELHDKLSQSKRVLVLTGAGVSAESGIPTFRGSTAGSWRGFTISELACPEAFQRSPSQVWELYHYRREKSLAAKPNLAHVAIAKFEQFCLKRGIDFMLATQNIDRLHQRAGSSRVIELHRSLFLVRCTACDSVTENYDSPICEALRGRGDPSPQADSTPIPEDQLPRCAGCSGLLRPYVVWFGEPLNEGELSSVQEFANMSDFVLVVGTSNAVYPAAMIAPDARRSGAQLAEFNLDASCSSSNDVSYFVAGPCGSTLPKALPRL
ncbi:hypothetical protein BOX15_Mlig028070g2, partial [Macrostomum lignano]